MRERGLGWLSPRAVTEMDLARLQAITPLP